MKDAKVPLAIRASEPKDVMWEHFGYSNSSRTWRGAFTYSLTLLIVLVFTLIAFLINEQKDKESERANQEGIGSRDAINK